MKVLQNLNWNYFFSGISLYPLPSSHLESVHFCLGPRKKKQKERGRKGKTKKVFRGRQEAERKGGATDENTPFHPCLLAL